MPMQKILFDDAISALVCITACHKRDLKEAYAMALHTPRLILVHIIQLKYISQ